MKFRSRPIKKKKKKKKKFRSKICLTGYIVFATLDLLKMNAELGFIDDVIS